MASKIRQASGDEVREWLNANPVEDETVGKRGRFSKAQQARFNDAHKGQARYVEGAEVGTVDLKVEVVSKSGKVRRENRSFTVSAVRQAARTASVEGLKVSDRGPLSQAVKDAAASVLRITPETPTEDATA